MRESAGRKFSVEVHPTGWHFPASQTWIAGWIQPVPGRTISDVRIRLHHRVIVGLSGLPHQAFAETLPDRADPARPGFSFLIAPQTGANLLRLESRDDSGEWTEFFRTTISVAPHSNLPFAVPSLSLAIGRLTTALLKHRLRSPERSWAALADESMAAFVTEPLQAHPNAPFIGALEEPGETGRLRYGRIPVTGWLAHPTAKITRVLAVIDPLPGMVLPHNLARGDIVGVFPALEGHGNTAFVGELALPGDLAAPVLLKIFAELANGESHLVFARRFAPHLHGDSGHMPPLVTGLNFARAVWALHRSAGQLAVSRHGVIKAAREAWAGYRSVPAYRPKRHLQVRDKLPAQAPGLPHQRTPALTLIAATDDMCATGSAQYYHIGREAVQLVRHAVAAAGGRKIESILDLPCGYGRVARWFRDEYPDAQLTVSDTQAPGVAFCVEHLGATGVHADVNGSHWDSLRGPYDIIWCGSLLTHFDRERWITHLRRFAERLTPHGVIVFTSHGLPALEQLQSGAKDYGLPPADVVRLQNAAVADGFGYVDYADTPGYGISMAQPGWIDEFISRETTLQVREYRRSAWDEHQDVVVCSRRAPPEGKWWKNIF